MASPSSPQRDSEGNERDDRSPARQQKICHMLRCLQCNNQLSQNKSKKLIEELKKKESPV